MLKIRRAVATSFKRFNSKVNKDCLYTKDHEWVKMDGKIGTIGISDFAQDALGDITHMGYDKKVGDVVKSHEKIGDVESVKTVSVIYSPVAGKITAINNELDENGALVNEDCYGKGWMIKVDVTDKSGLMTAAEYEKYCKENAH